MHQAEQGAVAVGNGARLFGAVAHHLPHRFQGGVHGQADRQHRFIVLLGLVAQLAGLRPAADVQAEAIWIVFEVSPRWKSCSPKNSQREDNTASMASSTVDLPGIARPDDAAERRSGRPLQDGGATEILNPQVSDLHARPPLLPGDPSTLVTTVYMCGACALTASPCPWGQPSRCVPFGAKLPACSARPETRPCLPRWTWPMRWRASCAFRSQS